MTAQGFDVFISYARRDDVGGRVRALRDLIVAESQRVDGRSLRVFLDQDGIRSLDDWRSRILWSLRSSKVLLVCVTPTYFQSEACRWEWQEHSDREARLRVLTRGQTIAPVYLEDVSKHDLREAGDWAEAVRSRHALDLRSYFRETDQATIPPQFHPDIERLGDALWQRVDAAQRAEQQLGNLPRTNLYFVGRSKQLEKLNRAIVAPRSIGVANAVHGLGGIGKTELAIQYAHIFREQYGAGVWQLRAEGVRDMLLLLSELRNDPTFNFRPRDKSDLRKVGLEILAELSRRIIEARESGRNPGVLLLLDNVSEPSLLSEPQIANLPQAENLYFLATTRLGNADFKNARGLSFTELDELTVDESIALIRERQPGGEFSSKTYARACRSIAEAIGGFHARR